MPTGYTAGIVDGKTEKFQDFAKLCMRAFGATIHMRDESMAKEYEPRIPSSYHAEALKQGKEELKKAKAFTDEKLIDIRTKELKERKKYCIKKIKETKKTKDKLEQILIKAKEFKPPTPDHEEIKKFMIEQLETTIDYDGNTSYYDKELQGIKESLKNIDANQIRISLIEDAKRDVAYHLKENTEEIKRCKDSNTWAEIFLKSLNC